MGLSRQRRAFVEHYCRCWIGKEAAIRAGYAPKSAHARAWKLLQDPDVQALIKARLAELKMGTDEVLLRLTEQARAEYAEYLGDEGTVDLVRMLADGKGHLIKGTKWDRRGNLVVEFYDAQAALVQIGRAHGMFIDKTALTDPSGTKEYRPVSDDGYSQALSSLADALREELSRAGTEPDSVVGAAEQASVAGAAKSG